ncbi:hypothetical protein GCM10008019_28700 [Deinococcus soli (ex Cha et al. 2016)]|nr:hypothetical protein GCM10008019_28700 [Deinococcus soli (ex Cha et al. 2016)]
MSDDGLRLAFQEGAQEVPSGCGLQLIEHGNGTQGRDPRHVHPRAALFDRFVDQWGKWQHLGHAPLRASGG